MSSQDSIPDEINDHLKIFGKVAEDVDYSIFGECPFCSSRIDEYGYCACGGNLGVSWLGRYLYKRCPGCLLKYVKDAIPNTKKILDIPSVSTA